MAHEHHLKLNPRKTLFYRVVAGLIKGAAFIGFRPIVRGTRNIPVSGPVLVAPTHRSNLDFAFTLFMSQRKVFFMAKDSLFRIPIVGPALAALGAFPVTRGAADREAMKAAEAVLGSGHALILFPEGTRKAGPVIEELRDGAMFIAARTGATVVPVGLAGTDRSARSRRHPRRVVIEVRDPIAPPANEGRVSRSAVAAKTIELRGALQAALTAAIED